MSFIEGTKRGGAPAFNGASSVGVALYRQDRLPAELLSCPRTNEIAPHAVWNVGHLMQEPSDAELVRRSIAGEESAYLMLVRRHYRAAFAVALACTRQRSDAEDVCHDAFVRVALHLEDCRNPERFTYWLCAIVRNHARNRVFRDRVRRAEMLTADSAVSPDDPARTLGRKELRRELERAIAALPAVQREVLLLHDLEGYKHAEIAELVGTTEGTSRQHLFQARRRLRELLGTATSMDYFNE